MISNKNWKKKTKLLWIPRNSRRNLRNSREFQPGIQNITVTIPGGIGREVIHCHQVSRYVMIGLLPYQWFVDIVVARDKNNVGVGYQIAESEQDLSRRSK